MNNIARAQDDIMATLRITQYQPKLNKVSSEQYWLDQPGAPKAKRKRERPKTLPYEEAILQWQKVP